MIEITFRKDEFSVEELRLATTAANTTSGQESLDCQIAFIHLRSVERVPVGEIMKLPLSKMHALFNSAAMAGVASTKAAVEDVAQTFELAQKANSVRTEPAASVSEDDAIFDSARDEGFPM